MLKKTIILDPVDPADFSQLKLTYCCEHCTHFASEGVRCTLGFNCENHLKDVQIKTYERTGKMAFCRFLEID